MVPKHVREDDGSVSPTAATQGNQELTENTHRCGKETSGWCYGGILTSPLSTASPLQDHRHNRDNTAIILDHRDRATEGKYGAAELMQKMTNEALM